MAQYNACMTSPDSDGWNDFLEELSASGIGFAVTADQVRRIRTVIEALSLQVATPDEVNIKWVSSESREPMRVVLKACSG